MWWYVDLSEGYEVTALRELNEELGVNADLEDLIFLGLYRCIVKDPTRNVVEKAFRKAYLYKTKREISDFKIQKAEISKIRFFKIESLKRMLRQKRQKIKFVPEVNYHFKVIRKIEKFLS